MFQTLLNCIAISAMSHAIRPKFTQSVNVVSFPSNTKTLHNANQPTPSRVMQLRRSNRQRYSTPRTSIRHIPRPRLFIRSPAIKPFRVSTPQSRHARIRRHSRQILRLQSPIRQVQRRHFYKIRLDGKPCFLSPTSLILAHAHSLADPPKSTNSQRRLQLQSQRTLCMWDRTRLFWI